LYKLTTERATLHFVLLWTKFQAVCVLISLACGTFFSFSLLIPTPFVHILTRKGHAVSKNSPSVSSAAFHNRTNWNPGL